MRILQVLWSGEIGGSEKHVSDLLKGLSEKHECEVCFLTHPGTLGEELSRRNIRWFALGMRNGLDVIRLLSIRKQLDRGRFEIIHEHSGNKLAIYAYRRFAPSAKTVFTIHNGEPVSAFSFLRIQGEFAKLRRFHKVIAVSQPVAEMWEHAVEKISIAVVPNGIDVERFKNCNVKNIDARAPLISVGRLIPSKRMLALVNLLGPMLKEKGRILRIVGDGPERGALEARIRDAGWSSNIQMLGSRTDLPSLFDQSSLFVFASAYESFGLAIAEAAAAGLPCVAIEIENLSQVIRNNETGVLVPEIDSSSQFGNTVSELLENPSRLQRLGENARQYIASHYSLTVMQDRMESLYQSLQDAS